MPSPRTDRTLQASVVVDATPGHVWPMVSDLRRTGEWSEECSRVVPVGPIREGAWLLGFNRRRWVRWATLSRVSRYETDREITWKVVTNGSLWTYRLEPAGSGTRITETRQTPNGVGRGAALFIRLFLGGQVPHDDELEAGMQRGLVRIKSLAEAAGSDDDRGQRQSA